MTSSASWAAAAHLVRSTGFGATGDLVDAVAAAGTSAWLSASLRAAPESDPGAAATPVPTFEALEPLAANASREDRQKRRQHENLARELMELFALGRTGGYTEHDVREGARARTAGHLADRFAREAGAFGLDRAMARPGGRRPAARAQHR